MKRFGIAFLLIFALVGARRHTPPHNAVNEEMLRVQVLLDRAGFSPGEIDAHGGANTVHALDAFQQAHGLPVTGQPDDATMRALGSGAPQDLLTKYTIQEDDVRGPFIPYVPKDWDEKATMPAMDYTSPVEELAEKFHVAPALLKQWNPSSEFSAGDTIQVPNFGDDQQSQTQSQSQSQAHSQTEGGTQDVQIVVSKQNSSLEVQSPDGQVLFFAPVTTGSEHDPLPIGTWKVTEITHNPTFLYNPELFWDADPSHSKAKIPPGPNNPVGVVWIGINAPHYGLHGTPDPGLIGHAESHGCIRMTNWDATKVAGMVKKGTTVIFQE